MLSESRLDQRSSGKLNIQSGEYQKQRYWDWLLSVAASGLYLV